MAEKQKIDLVATRTAERNAAQAAVDACVALDPDCAELATLQQALVVAQAALTAAQNELAAATTQRNDTAALVSPALLTATVTYTDAGSNVGGLCHATNACGFATQVQAFLDRHDAVGETAFAVSVDESEWRTAQRATDAAYGDYRLSACAADGKGYDRAATAARTTRRASSRPACRARWSAIRPAHSTTRRPAPRCRRRSRGWSRPHGVRCRSCARSAARA